ncbi:MAG: alkaline phosphatase family protein [Acidobacteriota bacterium]
MSVDDLRDELKRLGYLSHGIERWFALDPWKSRTFWSELLVVAAKGAALSAVFAALPVLVIMVLRNRPLGAMEVALLAVIYIAGSFAAVFGLVLMAALVIKLRPSLPIRSPRGLALFAMLVSGVMIAAEGAWWSGFRDRSSVLEIVAAVTLFVVAFVVMSLIFAAALLSFSIHETHEIPSIRRRSVRVPLIAASALILAGLFVVPFVSADGREEQAVPEQVVVVPRTGRLALVAVDGLSGELFSARPQLRSAFAVVSPLEPFLYRSSPEVWATVGTGTGPAEHRVHAVDGIVLAGSSHLVQTISDRDFLLRRFAPALHLASAQPLPPTVRRRAYVWEILAARGIPSQAVNWWTSGSSEIALTTATQEEIFGAAALERSPGPVQTAQRIDAIALTRFLRLISAEPRFTTVYLPALDIVLNRVPSDSATQLTASMQEMERLATIVGELRTRGYEIMLVGVPGPGQRGTGVLATTFALATAPVRLVDVAPTMLAFFGFPASDEMAGRSLLRGSTQPRIPSYGPRGTAVTTGHVDEEYYETLRSLGYIR